MRPPLPRTPLPSLPALLAAEDEAFAALGAACAMLGAAERELWRRGVGAAGRDAVVVCWLAEADLRWAAEVWRVAFGRVVAGEPAGSEERRAWGARLVARCEIGDMVDPETAVEIRRIARARLAAAARASV